MALHFPFIQGTLDWPRGFFYEFSRELALSLAKTFGFPFNEFERKGNVCYW